MPPMSSNVCMYSRTSAGVEHPLSLSSFWIEGLDFRRFPTLNMLKSFNEAFWCEICHESITHLALSTRFHPPHIPSGATQLRWTEALSKSCLTNHCWSFASSCWSPSLLPLSWRCRQVEGRKTSQKVQLLRTQRAERRV